MRLTIDRGISDWIRFLSALMIAAHHYSQYAISDLHVSGIGYKLLSALGGYLGVAIFFFFSGYGLMESDLKRHLPFAAFVRRRFSKVYLPVLLVTLLWIGVCHLFEFSPQAAGKQIFEEGGFGAIFFGFYDGVLWFVKVLILLYVAFYAFSAIRQGNSTLGWAMFVLFTVAVQVWAYYTLSSGAAMSVPFFAFGAFASDFKDKSFGMFNISVIPLIIYPFVGIISGMHLAVTVNSAVLVAVVVALTRWKLQAACPAILSALAFDIYLVHNKVLMVGRTHGEPFLWWMFVVLTISAALIFYMLRSYLIRPFVGRPNDKKTYIQAKRQ